MASLISDSDLVQEEDWMLASSLFFVNFSFITDANIVHHSAICCETPECACQLPK
jgi:hypothetical protein